ncbi:hypothetical protein [Aeromonas jandaei]|uniref:hypothetical protein n=1 Tax=Aeromonas jandaei TaxID=650 RepID=UPI002AA0DD41|nr:hypothetical protein [Aeromonas jandaei]
MKKMVVLFFLLAIQTAVYAENTSGSSMKINGSDFYKKQSNAFKDMSESVATPPTLYKGDVIVKSNDPYTYIATGVILVDTNDSGVSVLLKKYPIEVAYKYSGEDGGVSVFKAAGDVDIFSIYQKIQSQGYKVQLELSRNSLSLK